jgi:hypothetical protein
MSVISLTGLSKAEADFFIASSEGYSMEEPRRCRMIRRLCGDHRDDYLLVRLEPPLIGQPFGLGASDIDQVVLATRHLGDSLFNVRRWPVSVHVARPLVPLDSRDLVHDDEMEEIAWAEIYQTEQSARDKAL